MPNRLVLAVLLITAAVASGLLPPWVVPPLLAQDRPGSWDSDRAREIARTAIEARRHAYADSTLRRFRARAEGHVYFVGEFGDQSRLIRADQIALDVRWQAPGRALQLLVGRRHEKHLPTTIRYHIDHLSLVLDNFGDRIRLGEGEEVRGVLHPAAPGALDFYEYRLAGSQELRVGSRNFRLHRLDVRPRDPDRPGLVGSMFVERSSGAIARLRCTFTRAAYLDPAVERIRVDLESALWEGRWWLPAEQRVEVRRQVSWLRFPAAGIIRTRIRVLDYEINDGGSWHLPPGERVATVSAEALASYDAWERPLHAGPADARPGTGEDVERLRGRVRSLVSPSHLLGTAGFRAYVPRASDILRARRAEGVLVGGGGAYATGSWQLDGWLGWAFGAERPEVEGTASREAGPGRIEFRAFANRLADVGPWDVAAGPVSTAGLATAGEDYTDPYFEDGAAALYRLDFDGAEARLGLSWREQESASLVGKALWDASTRPVRPIAEGRLVALETGARLGPESSAYPGARLRLDVEAGLEGPGDFGYTRWLLQAEWRRHASGDPWGWGLEGVAGAATGALPPQRLFLLGGRGSLPGHRFRTWGGDRFALARGELSRDVVSPWARLRVGSSAGWVGVEDAGRDAARLFGVTATSGPEASASVGLGLLYDVLRLDLARGLTGGEWALLFSVDPSFWGML